MRYSAKMFLFCSGLDLINLGTILKSMRIQGSTNPHQISIQVIPNSNCLLFLHHR